MPYMKTIPADR